jgi:hypothetical protein
MGGRRFALLFTALCESRKRHRQAKKKGHPLGGLSYLMLDDDLLSHRETLHYHRRYVVSLLSSGWDQVVPTLYGRQANRYGFRQILFAQLLNSVE